MKKHRPRKGSKADGRVRKAPRRSTASLLATIAPADSTFPQLADTWQWHASDHGNAAAPRKRRKGPPPRASKATQRPSVAPAKAAAPPASKLAPALLARLAAPLPEEARPTRRGLLPAEHREFAAAAILFLPVLLMSAALLVRQHADRPALRASLAAALHPVPKPTRVAVAPPAVPAVVRSTNISRPFEPISDPDPLAQAQLASATVSVARELAALHRPIPPPEPPADIAPAIAAWAPPQPPAAAPVPIAPPTPDISAAIAALSREVPPPAQPEAEPAPATKPAANLCSAPGGLDVPRGVRRSLPPLNPDGELAADPLRFGRALAAAAVAETHSLVIYNANYMTIAYPRGDVPALFGVCTDVVIRAYRALDIDLQELVHQTRPGSSDPNIDHRRTEMLRHFFATYGEQLPVTPYVEDYLPGDIVTYYRPQNRSSTAHIAVVTAEIAPTGRPMIAHNRGWGVQLEDALFVDQMTGHYRFRGPTQAAGQAVASLKRNLVTAAKPLVHQGAEPLALAAMPPLAGAAPSGTAVTRTAMARVTRISAVRAAVAKSPLHAPMGLGAKQAHRPDTDAGF